MKCPSCGKENPPGEQYCLDCGDDLTAAPVAPAAPAGNTPLAIPDDEFQRMLSSPPPPKSCPHCGAVAPAGGAFCDNCGEPLAGGAAAATQPSATAGSAPAPEPPSAVVGVGAAAASAPAPIVPPELVATSASPAAIPGSAPAPPPSASTSGTGPVAPPSGPAIRFDLAGPASASTAAMTGSEARVGRRDADAGIYPEIDFEGNDFVVDGGERVHAVSRRHGRIFDDGGTLKYEDAGSTNGSTVDGAAVLPHDPQPLKDGSVIVLGRTCRITVHIR